MLLCCDSGFVVVGVGVYCGCCFELLCDWCVLLFVFACVLLDFSLWLVLIVFGVKLVWLIGFVC